MAAPDRPIGYFSVPVPQHVPRPPHPERVTICSPAPGANVPPNFQANGVLEDPDTDLQSCDVGGKQADSTTVSFPNWTASFTNVLPTTTPVPLTAVGNHNGIDCVLITVSIPPPGSAGTGTACIQVDPTGTCRQAAPVQQQAPVPERRNMLRHLRVERRDPTHAGGYALRLEFRGTGKARFIVGGTLATPDDLVENVFAGEHQAERIVNKGGEWQAVFENVLPGAHVLKVKTKAGVTDQAPILIEATE